MLNRGHLICEIYYILCALWTCHDRKQYTILPIRWGGTTVVVASDLHVGTLHALEMRRSAKLTLEIAINVWKIEIREIHATAPPGCSQYAHR